MKTLFYGMLLLSLPAQGIAQSELDAKRKDAADIIRKAISEKDEGALGRYSGKLFYRTGGPSGEQFESNAAQFLEKLDGCKENLANKLKSFADITINFTCSIRKDVLNDCENGNLSLMISLLPKDTYPVLFLSEQSKTTVECRLSMPPAPIG